MPRKPVTTTVPSPPVVIATWTKEAGSTVGRVAPTLRTRLRWRIQDVIETIHHNRTSAIIDDLPRFEERLCTEIEKVLTESKIDLDTTK